MPSSLITSPPKGVGTANELLKNVPLRRSGWCFEALAGRYVEITGGASSAALSAVCELILEAQKQGGLVAWVGKRKSMFYPPDLVRSGIDLKGVVIVFVDEVKAGLRTVELLLRSSAFAAVVLDICASEGIPIAAQTRFIALAKEQQIAFIEITRMSNQRVLRSSLAALRVETSKERNEKGYCTEVRALKDKRTPQGWKRMESFYGPDGMC